MKIIPNFEDWLKENEPEVYNCFKPRYDFEVAFMKLSNALQEAITPMITALDNLFKK